MIASPPSLQPYKRLLVAGLVCSFVAGPIVAPNAYARRRAKHTKAATLEIMSMTAGADIYVDDKLVGKVPLAQPLELTPGTHTIRLQKRGFTPFVDTVRIGAGKQEEIEADLVPSGGVLRIKCNVRRAQVLLNDKPIGRTPFDGDIGPGKHTLQVVATGKLRDKRLIEVRAGQVIDLDVQLKDIPPPIVQKDNSLLGKWWFWTAVGTVVVSGVTVGVLSARVTEVAPPSPDATISLP